MPTQAYERYGLTGNPFRDLASETVEDVAIIHVNQEVDDALRTIRDEVFDRENRAVVAVTGALGAGKTERLLLTASEGRERSAFTVFYDLTNRTEWVLRGLAEEIRKAAEKAKVARAFGSPAWVRAVAALEKSKDPQYDPREAGRALAAALNDRAPALLLLNDLHNLVEGREVDAFVEVLQELVDQIKPGVLLMFSAYGSYLAWLSVNHPAFATRINRTFQLTALTEEEAGLLLAKKMLAKRVVEDLDPIFPFDLDGVRELNRAAGGNPRRLIELADLAIEHGIAHRAYRVDGDLIRLLITSQRKPASSPAAPRAVPAQPGTPPGSGTAAPAATSPVKKGPVLATGPAPWSESR